MRRFRCAIWLLSIGMLPITGCLSVSTPERLVIGRAAFERFDPFTAPDLGPQTDHRPLGYQQPRDLQRRRQEQSRVNGLYIPGPVSSTMSQTPVAVTIGPNVNSVGYPVTQGYPAAPVMTPPPQPMPPGTMVPPGTPVVPVSGVSPYYP